MGLTVCALPGVSYFMNGIRSSLYNYNLYTCYITWSAKVIAVVTML